MSYALNCPLFIYVHFGQKGSMQYTTPQVLEIVGISRRTLQVWIADGKVNKTGGQGAGRLWDVSDVKKLLDLKQNSVRGRKPLERSDGEGGRREED
jgi:phage terminase Nu1 subunit (DNA packaging protein)